MLQKPGRRALLRWAKRLATVVPLYSTPGPSMRALKLMSLAIQGTSSSRSRAQKPG